MLARFTALSTAILLTAMLSAVGSARAEKTTVAPCPLSHFAGAWIAPDSENAVLVRLEINETCEKITVEAPPASASPWDGMLKKDNKSYIRRTYELRAFSPCRPANCVWGRTPGRRDADGVLKASFRLFWSERFLEITPDGNAIKVRWRIEYVGRKKPDQIGEMHLVRDD